VGERVGESSVKSLPQRQDEVRAHLQGRKENFWCLLKVDRGLYVGRLSGAGGTSHQMKKWEEISRSLSMYLAIPILRSCRGGGERGTPKET